MAPSSKIRKIKQKKTEDRDRVYINVPYSSNSEAKKLGCHFDPNRKRWYTSVKNTKYNELLNKFPKKPYRMVNGEMLYLNNEDSEPKEIPMFDGSCEIPLFVDLDYIKRNGVNIEIPESLYKKITSDHELLDYFLDLYQKAMR